MPSRLNDDILLDLVGRIYDAAIDPKRWPEFLDAFADAVQAQGTLIYTHNVETSQASTAPDDPSSLNVAVRFDPEHVRALGEHYNLVNVWAHNEAVLKPGRPVTGSMLYPVRDLPKTEFYNGWLRPQDFFHALGGIIVQDGPWATKFSALRGRRAGDYTSDELRLYEQLLPHLARAAQLQRRFSFLQALSTSSLAALESVPAAIMLLDASGRVLHVNEAAEAELRRGDPLECHPSGALRTRGGPQAQAAVDKAIAAALDPIRAAREKLKPVAQLFRRNGDTVSVQALSLSKDRKAGVAAISQRLAACALIIHGTASRAPTLGVQLLRHVYGLTPAEVQVVLAIADGDTLKSYAERRGISKHTAANQLKRAFEKTGMRRQSDLVRWLLQWDAPALPKRAAQG